MYKNFEFPINDGLRWEIVHASKIIILYKLIKLLKWGLHFFQPLNNIVDFWWIRKSDFSKFGIDGLVFTIKTVLVDFLKVGLLLPSFRKRINCLDLIDKILNKFTGYKQKFSLFHQDFLWYFIKEYLFFQIYSQNKINTSNSSKP